MKNGVPNLLPTPYPHWTHQMKRSGEYTTKWCLPSQKRPQDEIYFTRNLILDFSASWTVRTKFLCFFFFLIFIYLCASGVLRLWGLVLWPEIYPMPPALGVWSLSPWTTREITYFCFLGLPVYGVLLWHPRQTNTISVHKSLCFVVI